MNQILFYVGIVFAIFSFTLTIVIFLRENIIEATKYYFKIQNKKNNKFKNKKENNKKGKITIEVDNTEMLSDQTILLEGEDTEILRIAKNYATTLLSAEEETDILQTYEKNNLL